MSKKETKIICKELEIFQADLEERKEEITKDIILKSIINLRIQQPIGPCYKKIDIKKLPKYSEKMIGKIIGREGKHKDLFTKVTGVTLELTENKEAVFISKYNTLDLELAKRVLDALIVEDGNSGAWESQEKMSELFEKKKKQFQKESIQEGKKLLEEFLKYESPNEYLSEMTGYLKYIYSYRQNMFDHCCEVAQLSANVACQIGLDPLMAKRAGFLHDIGKAIANFECHVEIGLEIANKVGLEDYIKNTIESHHKKVPANNPYAMIVAAMDKISAGRIGARPMQKSIVEKRNTFILESLEKIDWIEKVSLKSGGHLIEIFIKINSFNFQKLPEMKKDVKNALSDNTNQYEYNYQIKIKIIYEETFFVNDI